MDPFKLTHCLSTTLFDPTRKGSRLAEYMGTFRNSPGSYRMRLGGFVTPGILNIIIACTGVFLVQTLLTLFSRSGYSLMLREFGLVPYLVTHGLRLWQPVTYLFLHGGLWHLLFNMLFLWMFGCDLERSWGRQRLYNYFFLTGIGAAVVNIIVKSIIDPHGVGSGTIPTIGASGAIYGILLASAILYPDRRIWLIPFPVMIPMKIYVMGAVAIEFFSTLGSTGDNVSHVTHLGGMLVGYLYLRRGSWFFRARNSVSDWKRTRARRKFEVYMRKNRNEPPSRPDQWVN
jgi:membrane associated rhomboid family serine protease